MSNEIATINQVNGMTTVEIAELTGKEHRNVKRDTETMLTELYGKSSLLKFEQSYTAENRQTYTCYSLEKIDVLTLISGYSIPLRARIIRRLEQLEGGNYKTILGISTPIADHVEATLKVAKLFGLEGNQALLSTNRAVKEVTGVDCMALLNINGLTKADKTQYFTPSILGKKIGISAIKFNQMLRDAGLQTEERDGKNNLIWNVTEKGKPYCEMVDTGKKHNGGSPVLQIKWSESVIEHCPMN